MNFAMTSLTNQLVLVGGWDPVTLKPKNQIALFTSGRWTSPFLPMKTSRWSSTAVCFSNHIIVAGGFDDRGDTLCVEVLDVKARRWYTAESLPNPRTALKSTIIGNTLYLMGGRDHTSSTKVVLKINLDELIIKAVSNEATPTLWQVISDTPLKCSTPLSVSGSLIAVGGHNDHDNPSSSIHLYQPDTKKWVKVGDLPTACHSCTCSVLPNGDVILAGGWSRDYLYISTIHYLSISTVKL